MAKTHNSSHFTFESFLNFAQAYGVMDALRNSILAAVITVLLSIAIGNTSWPNTRPFQV